MNAVVPRLEDLRSEYCAVGIGPMILAEITKVVGQVAGRYPAPVYGRAPAWGQQELDDLVQDVVVGRMLEEQQLYWVLSAANLDGFRGRIGRQVKRTLARRRVRTVKDNLLDRSKQVLERPPFGSKMIGRRALYFLTGSDVKNRDPTDAELRDAAVSVWSVPRAAPAGGGRAPVVYSRESLSAVLRGVAESLPCHFSMRDLDTIFDRLLSPWIPSFTFAETQSFDQRSEELTPEDYAIAKDTARRVIVNLNDEQKLILRLKRAGVEDAEVARALGVSRPTAAKRKSLALGVLESHLLNLPGSVREEVLCLLDEGLAGNKGGL